MKVAKIINEAYLPTVKYSGDAGMDFYTYRKVSCFPHKYVIIKTGIRVEIPKGCVGLLKPKGSNNFLIGSGVIDENYTGEILFKIFNTSDYLMMFPAGTAIGQMIIVRNIEPVVEVVSNSYFKGISTSRGERGGIKGA